MLPEHQAKLAQYLASMFELKPAHVAAAVRNFFVDHAAIVWTADEVCLIANRDGLEPTRQYVRDVLAALVEQHDPISGVDRMAVTALIRRGDENQIQKLRPSKLPDRARGVPCYWDGRQRRKSQNKEDDG